MFKCLIFVCLFVCLLYYVSCQGDSMLGPGVWKVNQVKKCENHEDYIVKVDITRKKMNRTHDGFTVDMNLGAPIDDDAAILIEIFKMVDGGQWKQYQILSDDSTPRFVNKYAKANAERALTMAGLETPDFPIPPGEYCIEDFIFDYSELPAEAVYGEFQVYAYMLFGDVKVACVFLVLEFAEED